MMPPEIISATPSSAAPAVRERPILFSAPMVRALLAGTKTQTRRVLTPQPQPCQHQAWPGESAPNWVSDEDGWHCASCGNGVRLDHRRAAGVSGIRCPYGVPGDLLWVRENHYLTDNGDEEYAVYAADSDGVREHLQRVDGLAADFPADVRAQHRRQRPSIHMPRWASRILLEVTDVRVERLQAISETDAIAEGIERSPSMGKPGAFQWCDYRIPHDAAEWFNSPIHSYETLWDQINGAGAWAANPWVWAVSFRRVPPTGGISRTPPGGSTA